MQNNRSPLERGLPYKDISSQGPLQNRPEKKTDLAAPKMVDQSAFLL